MKTMRRLLALIALIISCSILYAQDEKESVTVSFSFEQFRTPTLQLPYRQAVISVDSEPTKLIIYLHGGTSKGNDNVAQMNEPGIDSIARYVSSHQMDAVFIVPQCPQTDSWGGRLTETLKALIDDRLGHFNNIKDIYIFGGSMGGTGTWTMISKYPDFFSAAMPVAGNPSKCDVNAVATTPVFTVMGTDDRIMGMSAVNDFTLKLKSIGAKYMFEIEEGWSHEDTCIKSYTDYRLSWVFSNEKQDESSIADTFLDQHSVKEIKYWTLSGIPVKNPSNGFYLVQETYSDSSVKTYKVYIK